MSATRPIAEAYSPETLGSELSSRRYVIAGLAVTVYGLAEVPAGVNRLACLWLLHPRLGCKDDMYPVARSVIYAWNHCCEEKRVKELGNDDSQRRIGLIAAAIDQRNHGERLVDRKSNLDWKSGNTMHAHDMFGIISGTVQDVAQLIPLLPSYISQDPQASHTTSHDIARASTFRDRKVVKTMVAGISLGGHAAWQCLFQIASVSSAVSVIGCPDYATLILDRASRTKRESLPDFSSKISLSSSSSSYLKKSNNFNVHGREDVARQIFDEPLIDMLKSFDPASSTQERIIAMIKADNQQQADPLSTSTFANARATEIFESRHLHPPSALSSLNAVHETLQHNLLSGKRMLNMSGANDRLVPYSCSKAFLSWLSPDETVHVPSKSINDQSHEREESLETQETHGREIKISAASTSIDTPRGKDNPDVSKYKNSKKFTLVDKIYADVQHYMSPDMARDLNAFIVQDLLDYEANLDKIHPKSDLDILSPDMGV